MIVRVAIVDSGVHAAHPHVGGVAGGIGIDAQGRVHDDYVDRLGHGTAVAAAIREKAPDAELVAVKVFDRELSTNMSALVEGIDWAIRSGAHLINLSLGTTREVHEPALRAVIERATAANAVVVSARMDAGERWLPGSLPGVLPVEVDATLPRDRYAWVVADGTTVFRTSGFAREIPGVPPERNLNGVSLAVANMVGFAARAMDATGARGLKDLVAALSA